MTQPAPRFGCLGFFWICGLLFFSIASVASLFWLNPVWFDRMAFWRGKIYPTGQVILPASESDAASLAQINSNAQPPPIKLWDEMAVQTSYSPQTGATVKTMEGATLEFGPNSIREAQTIRVVPVVHIPESMIQDRVIPLGPLHDIQIGSEEHYTFDRPVPMTIPFNPDRLPKDLGVQQIAIGTWEDGNWRVLPSRVDELNHTVTADLPHASVEGLVVITAVAAGGTAIKFTETGSAIYEQMRLGLKQVYKTANFAIHYSTDVGLGVPPDNEYPLAKGRQAQEAPLYVIDIGSYLEEARAGLDQVGMHVGPGSPYRWDAFLVAMPNFGASDLGGPLMIDNDFKEKGTYPANYEYRLRATTVHELIHVAQDDYFNTFNAESARWWLESTAEYLANVFLQQHGYPTPDINYYVQRETNLPATPIDKAEELRPYAYAGFYRWLQEHGVDMLAVIKGVNSSGQATAAQLDRTISSVSGKTLSDLFLEFATDYYHNNLWSGAWVPFDVVNKEHSTNDAFSTMVRSVGGKAGSYFVYVERQVSLNHLSAQYFNLHADMMPEDKSAKVVIHIPKLGEGFSFAEAGGFYVPYSYPAPGQPAALLPITADSSEGPHTISARIVSPAAVPNDVNQISLIVGNNSASQDFPSVTVRRWLLIPPTTVTRTRRQEGGYHVSWQESELKQKAADTAFKGYNVYRRKIGESEFPKTPLNDTPVREESYEDTPPDKEDYAYTVSVVDIFGNESALAPIDDKDPFQGAWEGKIYLVDGDFVEPIMKAVREATNEDDSDNDKVRKSNEEIRQILEQFQKIAKLGVPIRFQIGLEEGKYTLKPTHVFYKSVEADVAKPGEMLRAGPTAIVSKEKPENGDPLLLELHRPNEINQIYQGDVDTGNEKIHYSLRIAVTREEPPPQN